MRKVFLNNNMTHGFRIIAVCILVIFSIFLPYLPGEYDPLAVMISGIVQMASFVSLLLIPIGVWWVLHEIAQRKKNGARRSASFAVAALVVLGLIVVVSTFTAFGGVGNFRGSFTLGILIPIVFVYLIISVIIPRIRQMKNADIQRLNFIPFYLIIIPAVVVVFRSAFINTAVEQSTNRAIEQSEILIQDLEEYYSENEQYPISLQGLWKDYSPGVSGIEKYYYELNGEAYNLFFEQFSSDLFAREIVMYNKLDEHVIRSHPSFMFSLPPEEFERYRGYFAEFDLPEQHWKYFLFD